MKNILIAIFLLSQIYAQFLDSASPIGFEDTGRLSKVNSVFTLMGSSKKIPKLTKIEGAVLRFDGDSASSVEIQYVFTSGAVSEKMNAKIFTEPGSSRFLASVLKESLEIVGIRYFVKSTSSITFLNGGLFIPEKTTKFSDTNIDQMIPKRLDVDKPKIISRAEWGARNPKYDYSNHPYFNKMTLHHSAGWAATTLEEGKAAVKSIQEFHQDGRGWSDIGYHFLVDMGGNIYQGRPETVLGAHVGGANTGNIGVCILGCYHPPESSIPCYDEMTYNSEQSLIQLYAWISDTYGVEPKLLKGHRDYFGTTSCPGNNVWSKLPELRSEISLFIMYGFQPTRFALFQNYPNPFNSSTTLHYDLPKPSSVVISIYDILGNEVIELVNEEQHYGYKKIIWNGENREGNKVSPGVYFYKAKLGELIETKKMTLMK
tara:strand:- start:1566 stop:2852 length:1287 start_codon:yes stop_codon:yes gene_type:complete